MSSWTTPPADRDEALYNGAGPTSRTHEHAPTGQEHHLHLPAGAHVADRRGLTATGAVAIALALGLVGALIDVNTGRGLRTVFAICFIAGSALAAMLAHREDLKATVVMPPLTYCVLALVGAGFGHTQAAGSWVKTQGLELVSALILGAPVLYGATGLALVIALVRARSAPRP
ncbi:MAG: DUF6542 domain-containing protein [Mycobacteriales bacterium]